MKRHNVLLISMVVLLLGATAQGQQRSPNPRAGGADSPPLSDVFALMQALERVSPDASIASARAEIARSDAELSRTKTNLDRAESLLKNGLISREVFDRTKAEYDVAIAQRDAAKARLVQAEAQAAQTGTAGQRGGGGRGSVDTGVESQLRELERFINRAGGPVVVTVASGAWWSNTALVARLGMTDDQKAKIEKSFENHRLNLESSKALLEREEAQLARLLEAEPVDRNASLAQIYRVVNARGEMERTNAAMMLEMREHLTRAQWTQLQAQSNATMRITPPGTRNGRGQE